MPTTFIMEVRLLMYLICHTCSVLNEEQEGVQVTSSINTSKIIGDLNSEEFINI